MPLSGDAGLDSMSEDIRRAQKGAVKGRLGFEGKRDSSCFRFLPNVHCNRKHSAHEITDSQHENRKPIAKRLKLATKCLGANPGATGAEVTIQNVNEGKLEKQWPPEVPVKTTFDSQSRRNAEIKNEENPQASPTRFSCEEILFKFV